MAQTLFLVQSPAQQVVVVVTDTQPLGLTELEAMVVLVVAVVVQQQAQLLTQVELVRLHLFKVLMVVMVYQMAQLMPQVAAVVVQVD